MYWIKDYKYSLLFSYFSQGIEIERSVSKKEYKFLSIIILENNFRNPENPLISLNSFTKNHPSTVQELAGSSSRQISVARGNNFSGISHDTQVAVRWSCILHRVHAPFSPLFLFQNFAGDIICLVSMTEQTPTASALLGQGVICLSSDNSCVATSFARNTPGL